MVFLGERLPEQEMFEKRCRFTMFLTSSHSVPRESGLCTLPRDEKIMKATAKVESHVDICIYILKFEC